MPKLQVIRLLHLALILISLVFILNVNETLGVDRYITILFSTRQLNADYPHQGNEL